MGLDEAACRDGYYAGLLHEVGTVGLPDDVVLQRNITEEQYQLYESNAHEQFFLCICQISGKSFIIVV